MYSVLSNDTIIDLKKIKLVSLLYNLIQFYSIHSVLSNNTIIDLKKEKPSVTLLYNLI